MAPRVLAGIAVQRPRCSLEALPRQPHESVLGAAAHLPEGTGDEWPEELSTEECERFDLAQGSFEGFDGIAVMRAKSFARGALHTDEGGGQRKDDGLD